MIAHRCRHIVPRRVLIIKPSALGDVVTAMPVLRGLKRTFPKVRTAWLLSDACAPLVAHDSQLDEVVPFRRRKLGRAWRSATAAAALWRLLRDLRRSDYDWVIDLQGLLRSGLLTLATRAPIRAGFSDAREAAWLFYDRLVEPTAPHTVDRNIALAQQLGLDARPEDMTLEVAPAAKDFATDLLKRQANLADGDFLVCVPPTRWQSKEYPVRHWRAVIGELSVDRPVVVLGTAADKDTCGRIVEGLGDRVVNLAGATSVSQMVAVIAASAGVVCCDSAAKFIAPAVGVPAVTLIGPTQTERTGPYRIGRAIVANVPCQGCLRRRCRPAVCMELIDPADVVSLAREMLASGSR
ncbi:hypothetical protein LCGC14_0238760 [marine sediment metagenome]|uniref:Lipopolysaccharide heptosyltransferase II n=1 Tax=marine sediment metagenome TaxID=412755 RepID=A0A0F9UCJ4_9ZZZZ|nr:glycosyltransferase family 9 protein [Phycisphaerae bacterium]HDZ42672.1 glycosyltransferase family 9 protein [Phycisphaerae bacterium]